MRVKIPVSDHRQIIEDFKISLIPMIQIAARYGSSRHAIWKILKKYDVDTSKHKMTVTCHCCEKIFLRQRCLVRNKKFHFCSLDCYYAWVDSLSDDPYIPNRNGQRIGRFIASKYFPIEDHHVVHHIDKNNTNNSPDNLIVFASQGDHIRHHRGFQVKFLWNHVMHLNP